MPSRKKVRKEEREKKGGEEGWKGAKLGRKEDQEGGKGKE